jgi:branched-chain amino acid transport system ATP-binding protein
MIVAEIYAIIAEINRDGTAILLVEQNLDQALTVCNRFVAMDRGRIVMEGRVGNAADRDGLMRAIAV